MKPTQILNQPGGTGLNPGKPHKGEGDKPMAYKPGVAGSIPGFYQSVGRELKQLPRLLRRFKTRTTAG